MRPPDVPGYRLVRRLGSGGFAAVWSARRDSDESLVAIKIGHVATAAARVGFTREADALARIGSPHVPELVAHSQLDDGRPYIVMQYLDGPTLADVLGRLVDPPSARWIRRVGDAILACLQAVHAVQLIHRDIKPENIVLEFEDDLLPSAGSGDRGDRGIVRAARLIDLGTAADSLATTVPVPNSELEVDSDAEGDEISVVVGSAEYMAPEQFAGEPPSESADVYAFGIILYEMLTLRVPFVGDLASIEHGHRALRPPRPSTLVQIPEAIERLCMSCLAKEPGKRPPDVTWLRHELAVVCASVVTTHSSGITRRSTRTAKLLTDARQPVVLFVVDAAIAGASADRDAVTGVVERRRGVIVRQRGGRYVCGFSVLDDDDPVQAALAAARELVGEHRVRVALHLAQLKVRRRRRRRGSALYGSAIDNADDWLPRGQWRGIVLTESLAAAVPEDALCPLSECPGFFTIATAPSSAADP
ncbi:MAG: serine/threonine-protein kinase, partial [Myxococcota bacterium]